MFNETSRYAGIETAELTMPDGRRVRYARRRLLPNGQSLPLLIEAALVAGDRLDLLAARELGDSEQYWRICDANDAMNPFDLLDPPGRRLRIPLPEASTTTG
ncbi:MAG: hypothetical protein SH847_25650 [Roseiflexaceae bacterium]|nr:hypothetical protein [Roseiflexaceae bacterium]